MIFIHMLMEKDQYSLIEQSTYNIDWQAIVLCHHLLAAAFIDFICILQCVILQLTAISITSWGMECIAIIALPYRYLHCIHITETHIAVIHVIHSIHIQLCMIFCWLLHLKLCYYDFPLEKAVLISSVEYTLCCWDLCSGTCVLWTPWGHS